MGRGLSFEDLAAIEPRLWLLLADAEHADDGHGARFCAYEAWEIGVGPEAGPLKTRLIFLVGYRAGEIEEKPWRPSFPLVGIPLSQSLAAFMEQLITDGPQPNPTDPRLMTPDAYELAYRTIFDALPPCRGCACVPEEG